MIVWTIITLVGAVLGIVGMFVANWAENHRRSSSTLPHDVAVVIGMIGWAIGALGLVASVIDHFQQ